MANIQIKHFLTGCATDVKETTLDPSENNFLLIANGIDQCSSLGKIKKDLGYTILGSQLQDNKSITGLYNFRQSSTLKKILATVDDATSDDTQLFYNTNVTTQVSESSASGQKVLKVSTTENFLVGDNVIIGKGTATVETKVIDTIQAGISLTMTVNLTNTHAAGVSVEQEWTEITGAETAWANEATEDVEMEGFLGYCFFVGYSANDGFLPVASLTGTTFSTTTNVTSMPQGKYIKRYGSRLYVGNTYYSGTAYPYRVYFSSIPSAGAITWTAATDYFDVDFGEEITGLGENAGYLIIFTEFSTYFYNSTPSLRKVFDIGCTNHESIQNLGKSIVWADKDNIWMSYQGSDPEGIGTAIKQLLQNSDYTKHTSTVIDNEYHLYLGNTQANGLVYANCEVIYSPTTKLWRWRCYADNMTKFTRFTKDGQDYLVMGTTDGEVMKKSKYTDSIIYYADNGEPIKAEFRTKAMDFGSPDIDKTLTKMMAFSRYGQGITARVRVFNKNNESDMPFQELGNISQFETLFNGKKNNNNQDIKVAGKFIQFEFVEYSKNQAFEFLEFVVSIDGLSTND